jgi:hypothetical protein
MQRQPLSIEIIAETYRRELLADAERVRPKTPARPRRRGCRAAAARLRLAAGGALIRAGHRLRGTPAAPGQPGVPSEAQ